MKIMIELGIPYRDILLQKVFPIETTTESTIEEVMQSFLIAYPDLAVKSAERGYVKDGRLKAVYTLNDKLAPIEEEIKDGDRIRVITPIVGG
jgi:sulfur carrier protein ThiS